MTTREKQQAPQRAETIQLRPALLRDRDAAAYLARSPSWIRAMRAADTKLRLVGKDPSGPRWVTIGQSVFYRLQDLDEWIERNSVDRGVVAFANRGGGAT